jgi:anti-sigma-K factor RskA
MKAERECDRPELAELVSGFALGCLDPEDEALVEAHLEGCSSCREELDRYEGVVGELAAALPSREPPARLAKRLDAPEASRRRWSRSPRLLAAAAALVVVLGAGDLALLFRSPSQAAPEGEAPLRTLALYGRAPAAKAFGTLVLDPVDAEGVAALRDLPLLGPDRRYELGLVKGGRRASGGLFSVDAKGYGSLLLDVAPGFADFERVELTVEPAGGSPQPTGRPIMEGKR